MFAATLSLKHRRFDLAKVGFISICGLLLSAGNATTQPGVSVTMKPANVQQRSFDPDKPPEGLPINPDTEAACSAALYSCHSDVDFIVTDEKQSAAGVQFTAEIKAVRITLCLDDTLWLPNGASSKLLAHEQGHAKLSEKFFVQSEKPVQLAADKLIGTTIHAEGKDHQSALEAAAQKVNDKINRVYARETTTASLPVQVAYDQLTDHSRNKVAEEKAIPLAMKHAESASTQPSK